MIFSQKKLFWQIFPATLAIILLSITMVAWYSSRSIDTFYIDDSAAELRNRARLIESHVNGLLDSGDLERLRRFSIESGRASGTRITIVDPSGTVLADSNENPRNMDNHRSRPEIDTAFSGVAGTSLRFSNTLGQRMLYAAIPLYDQTQFNPGGPAPEIRAVLRLSFPVNAIDAALSKLNAKIIAGSVVAILLAFIITLFVSRNISRPLEEMTKSAEHYSLGDFSQRMSIRKKSTSREVATLAAALDRMADQLDEKINTIIDQHNQLETVFSSMVEAVIAVDLNERIISLNAAAAKMFEVERRGAGGRPVQEVIRNVALHQQIQYCLQSGESFEDEISLIGTRGDTFLQTNVVSLSSGSGACIGVLVVLNDVTRLRRLENMRRDFVANVSHELRTPITSIRGYVETLLEGAIDDREHALQFLEIVLRQSEQLSEIIDDLLALSRIEQEAEHSSVTFELNPLLPVLQSAVQTSQHQAKKKGVEVHLTCPSDISFKMNRTLLEQAVVNLLINGITYSEPGAVVQVEAGRHDGSEREQVQIKVIDSGIGIAREHLPRLFERFYRSDRARSRKAGGTGLGLAIVKHIIQAHDGSVEVKSALGKGSEFIITIPYA